MTKSNLKPEMKLLLVEDDLLYQKMLVGKFKKIGIAVDVAVNPMSALQKVKSNPEKYEIVITDLKMPGKSGIEFVKELRQLQGYEKVPVITITGFPDKETISRAAGSGLNQILVKPFPFESLSSAVAELVYLKIAA